VKFLIHLILDIGQLHIFVFH